MNDLGRPNPSAPRDPTPCDPLVALFHQIGQLAQAMPTTPLEPGEEQTLGGVLFADGPAFVLGVGRSLRDSPDRLADVIAGTGEDGRALIAGQDQAGVWAAIHHYLAHLTRLARQTHLKLQAELIGRAFDVLKYVKATDSIPGVQAMDPQQALLRRLDLIEAYMIVDDYYASLQARRARRAKVRAEAASTDSASSEAAPAPTPSERSLKARARAQDQQSAQHSARFQREFLSFISERGHAFDTPPAGTPPAGTPPTGTPPTASTPPAGTPPAAASPQKAPAPDLPTLADDARPGTNPPMARNEDRLKDDFAATFEHRRTATLDQALHHPEATLASAQTEAGALCATLPVLRLDRREQEALSGKRHPLHAEIAESFARALERHPEMVQALGFGSGLLRHVTSLDRSVTRQIAVADSLMNGGDNGALICGAAGEESCRRVLDVVAARLADPRTPEAERGDLRAAFLPAQLQQADNAARDPRQPPDNERTAPRREGQPTEQPKGQPKEPIDKAADQAEMNRLLDAFLTRARGT